MGSWGHGDPSRLTPLAAETLITAHPLPTLDALHADGRSTSARTQSSPLGAGGMGVVCRARVTKLRDVALEVLPDHFATDPHASRDSSEGLPEVVWVKRSG
jgi:hypothetical protein